MLLSLIVRISNRISRCRASPKFSRCWRQISILHPDFIPEHPFRIIMKGGKFFCMIRLLQVRRRLSSRIAVSTMKKRENRLRKYSVVMWRALILLGSNCSLTHGMTRNQIGNAKKSDFSCLPPLSTATLRPANFHIWNGSDLAKPDDWGVDVAFCA